MQSRIIESVLETLKMSVLFNMKSGSNLTELIFPILILFLFSYILTSETNKMNNIYNNIYNYIFDFNKVYKWLGIKQKRTLFIEGKQCFKAGEFCTRIDNLFSDRFQAIWFNLSNKHVDNDTIFSVKELAHFVDYDESDRHNNQDERQKNKGTDVFIVDQTRWFTLDTDIHCRVFFNKESVESGAKKIVNTIELIQIEVFSYKKSLNGLIKYIDDITYNYIIKIQNIRLNKKYIYTYLGLPKDDDRCSNKYSNWEECEFKSFRTFDNLFFDSKQKLLDKLDFYENNEDWYKKEGHPYTFGIGLTGPPGTGKTSIIKCIANKLNRHLIVIPLNKLKTQREFFRMFF